MMMKRNSSRSREAMERTEFSRDATRLLREFQYLGTGGGVRLHHPLPPCPPHQGLWDRLQHPPPGPVLGAAWWWDLSGQLTVRA